MGQNLILNMNDHGFKVTAYNRTTSKVDSFLKNEAKGTNVVGAYSLQEMVQSLKKPRRVMMLVKGTIDGIWVPTFCWSSDRLTALTHSQFRFEPASVFLFVFLRTRPKKYSPGTGS